MATTTDIRKWANEQGGYDLKERGRLPENVLADYEAAHPDGAGVTEADFPPPPGDDGDGGSGRSRPRGGGRARKPRGERAGGGRGRRRPGLRERLRAFGTSGGPRGSLADWAEETWTDLSWLAAPIPPLSRMLQVQAPYAGVVLDDSVRGTPVDALLQPVARYSASFRALNGLMGPPILVGAICVQGEFVPNEAGDDYARDKDGRPLPTPRTAMMLQLLRYSMLQMAKVSDINADRIKARTEDMAARMTAVDDLIDSVFGWTPRPQQPGAAQAPPPGPPPPVPGGGQGPPPGTVYVYPPGHLTRMDDAGRDVSRETTAAADTI